MADNDDQGTIGPSAGSAIQPVYAQRSMKCYPVTESELKQIGLANLGVTIFVGLGGTCFGFGVDVFKDVQLAQTVPAGAKAFVDIMQPGAIAVGVVCWIIAGALWFWRRDMLRLIKDESTQR